MMSFDLGWTFTHSEAPRHSSDCHKLRLYSVVAWGLPGLLTLSLAFLQAILPWHSEFSPQIGHRKCFKDGMKCFMSWMAVATSPSTTSTSLSSSS